MCLAYSRNSKEVKVAAGCPHCAGGQVADSHCSFGARLAFRHELGCYLTGSRIWNGLCWLTDDSSPEIWLCQKRFTLLMKSAQRGSVSFPSLSSLSLVFGTLPVKLVGCQDWAPVQCWTSYTQLMGWGIFRGYLENDRTWHISVSPVSRALFIYDQWYLL